MTRYTIVVDDDDRHGAPEQPWTANVYGESEDGERENDSLGVAFGATAREAVSNLIMSRLNDWTG